MTSVRFAGELPMWLGLCLAVVVAVLSWRYYRRESFELSDWLKWFLPLLRSLAFFLGVMVLTGPVLRHRQVIGELGQVKIYFDASESMTMQDRHMSTGRKLLIAEQLGWLGEGKLDASLFHAADRLRAARQDVHSASRRARADGGFRSGQPAEPSSASDADIGRSGCRESSSRPVSEGPGTRAGSAG